MKKIFFTLVAACFTTLPLVAQNNVYYQKVPKLIPQADGSYRVNTDEFYFVPVEQPQPSTPTTSSAPQGEEPTGQQNNLGTIIEQKPVSMVVEKNKYVPGAKPYISLGVALLHSKANLDDDYAADDTSVITDTKPAFKFAFGERISTYVRLEAFYQYRQKIDDTYYGINVSAQMQDLGANLSVYANPKDNTRFFAGLGIAGTRTKVQASNLSATKWFATPSFFIGIETPLNSKTDIDVTAFYSHTLVHKWDIQNLETYGLAINLRFNFLEKTITYVK